MAALNDSADIENIGKRIKALRKERNLTLERLAELSGVSKGYLSRIENSQHDISFSILLKISRVLSIQLSSLIEEGSDPSPYVITRVADRKKYIFADKERDYVQWGLASTVRYKRMEPQLIEVPFKDSKIYQYNDERFVYVIEGTIQTQDGHILEVGDSMYITPNTPHGAISIGEQEAKVILVSCV